MNWRMAGSFSALAAEIAKTKTIERRDENFMMTEENPYCLLLPSFIIVCLTASDLRFSLNWVLCIRAPLYFQCSARLLSGGVCHIWNAWNVADA